MPTKTKYPSQQWTKDQPEEPHDKELKLRERQTPVLKIEQQIIFKKMKTPPWKLEDVTIVSKNLKILTLNYCFCNDYFKETCLV